ncbi:MAG: helix-turn-helix domain-containing protein [Lachnospiraceae bacterium]|nr:helix-turn-helix domain-containing protein [Lachnospiraceae bacterium]
MYAYKETYLEYARKNLGDLFDYAVNVHKMKANDFWDIFAGSKLARALSCGEPKYTVGMSGSELFAELIYDTYRKRIDLKETKSFDRSREYWAGFALAFYQWRSGTSYAAIRRRGIMLSDIVDLYVLHEASDEKFVEVMTGRMDDKRKSDTLKRLRIYAGLTQKELSEVSGVSLRMIQLYEQGQNDLSKAQASVVLSLAKSLGTDIEELIIQD